MKLNNKIAIITGGSNGIGKAISKRFLSEGANVIVFDIKKPDYDIQFIQVDIKDENQIKQAFLQIKKLDILVNNAGIYFKSSVEDTKSNELDQIINTNLRGTYLMSKYALPLLKKSHGSIVNISSGLGIVPEPESPAYCATKAAIIMLTKCMSQEYTKNHIRTNVILPGPIDTSLLRNTFKSEEKLKEYILLNPMKKIGTPDDVANVALFLVSDEARYVNGGMYSVDGGESVSSLYSK